YQASRSRSVGAGTNSAGAGLSAGTGCSAGGAGSGVRASRADEPLSPPGASSVSTGVGCDGPAGFGVAAGTGTGSAMRAAQAEGLGYVVAGLRPAQNLGLAPRRGVTT